LTRRSSTRAQSIRTSATSPSSSATCSAIPAGEPNAPVSVPPRLRAASVAPPT
jgi:hypothetical protein